MPDSSNLLTFALVALGMVLTPGPNMIYLVSRSISQGPKAGLISLAGVAVGFIFYVGCAAFGITALLMAVPYADALRYAGALYLLLHGLAGRQARWPFAVPGARAAAQLAAHVVHHGLVTNLLNPKIAVMYVCRCCRSSSSPITAAC